MAADPYAYYTELGDRRLLFTAADLRRAWLEDRLLQLAYWLPRMTRCR